MMNVKLAAGITIAALAAPVASHAAEASKPASQGVRETLSDTMITAKIKAEYAKDKDVSALNIKVDTDNKGVVTLSGTAKSQAEADRAVAIAKGVQGVSSVKNDIKVQAK